jgi:hypothetical protein
VPGCHELIRVEANFVAVLSPSEQGREEAAFEEISSKWYTCNPFSRSSEQPVAFSAKSTLASTEEKSSAALDAVDTNDDQNKYNKVLTEFYQKHNAPKVSEVSKTLEAYKVRGK